MTKYGWATLFVGSLPFLFMALVRCSKNIFCRNKNIVCRCLFVVVGSCGIAGAAG
jgi:hypothetical protein